ncbi:hypothetical protein TNCV_1169041 [Trichonephila clavipes]|uniref:Uncharacterized protein n=1 Tax=Trichonephila clavipes TaxID=2585209 RepID=A0A8X6T159_TRICX|nr:hypothetical protein TNCV_1169041 [Trichonephila clavipes]
MLELLTDLTCIAPLHGGSSAVLGLTHDTRGHEWVTFTTTLPWPPPYSGVEHGLWNLNLQHVSSVNGTPPHWSLEVRKSSSGDELKEEVYYSVLT